MEGHGGEVDLMPPLFKFGHQLGWETLAGLEAKLVGDDDEFHSSLCKVLRSFPGRLTGGRS